MAAVQPDGSTLTRLKSLLYHSGVLNHCVRCLNPRMQRANWSAMATLAQLISSCCVGAEPGQHSEAFHRLFLPSVVDGLLRLAAELTRRAECESAFRTVMESVGWMIRGHTHLTAHVLSSVDYEQIQMTDNVSVSLFCVQMWLHTCTCTSTRDFLTELGDDSVSLLLNDAISQLAVSCDSAVGGVSVKLILLMANQLGLRLQRLLLSFRGLDSLLNKDWRGRGFDKEVDQLIRVIQSSEDLACTERVRAACVIQAAWRSYQTRRRVRNLNRAVSKLQRKYRALRTQRRRQQEAQRLDEEIQYQVCLRRQQARRKFHLKQRRLLQLLPPDQVQSYLQECERRAAVVIQSHWRGFRERRRYENRRCTPGPTRAQQEAAMTLQRAVRLFLQRRRAAKGPPISHFWIGQKGLTDIRRAELQKQVQDYISMHPSRAVSHQECERLHEEVQLLLLSELQKGDERRREETRRDALMAHINTQLDKITDAPPLSVVTAAEADSFLSLSGPVATRARDAHNAMLQAHRLPWWRTLGNADEADLLGPAHVEGLEAELGGLYVGGATEGVTFDLHSER
ncbi:IQ calmodulin-binding motif-containing protein 1 isoform X2 [Sphaeramia orbicularis]|nr:IQ calmodulin-binding motif-containing protein 1 isoform X2 [Sphaeramia orbicularis]